MKIYVNSVFVDNQRAALNADGIPATSFQVDDDTCGNLIQILEMADDG